MKDSTVASQVQEGPLLAKSGLTSMPTTNPGKVQHAMISGLVGVQHEDYPPNDQELGNTLVDRADL